MSQFVNFRRPTNLSVVWTRRSRRVVSSPLPWEPDMMNPLDGHVVWPVPDNHSISVTLFKDPRTHEMEDKDWTFVLEDVSWMLWIYLHFEENKNILLSYRFYNFKLPVPKCTTRNAQCFHFLSLKKIKEKSLILDVYFWLAKFLTC